MGVLHDYFRAPDAAAAVDWAVGPGGDWRRSSGTALHDRGADWFDGKGMDPNVVLGQLVAFARGVPFDVRASPPVLIWPDKQSWPPGEARPGEESPWEAGPFLQQLHDDWTAALAGIEDDQLSMLTLQWIDIPEANFSGFGQVQATIADFRALSRRAREQGDGVFCLTVP